MSRSFGSSINWEDMENIENKRNRGWQGLLRRNSRKGQEMMEEKHHAEEQTSEAAKITTSHKKTRIRPQRYANTLTTSSSRAAIPLEESSSQQSNNENENGKRAMGGADAVVSSRKRHSTSPFDKIITALLQKKKVASPAQPTPLKEPTIEVSCVKPPRTDARVSELLAAVPRNEIPVIRSKSNNLKQLSSQRPPPARAFHLDVQLTNLRTEEKALNEILNVLKAREREIIQEREKLRAFETEVERELQVALRDLQPSQTSDPQ